MEPIAYVGNDGLVYVLDAPDAPPRCLTADAPDGAFTWPTWAPGRDALAVMRRVGAAADQHGAVELRTVADGAARRLWTARDGGPVCLYWAPNGQRLGLLVQDEANLHLLAATREGATAVPLLTGAPLYWAWASDGSALVAHVGGHYRRGDGARVLVVRLDGDRASRQTLDARPLAFRAPAWEPGGNRVAYAAATASDRRRLLLAEVASGQATEVADVGDQPAFVWAPQGGRLAFTPERTQSGLYEALNVLDTATGTIMCWPWAVLAFIWTPAGDALLRATVAADGERVAWERLDPATGDSVPLATCTPTQDLALFLAHFDQYAPAVRLYSADEPTLLLADAGKDGRHNGHTADHPTLWLVPNDPASPLRHLAGGTIAFFAP